MQCRVQRKNCGSSSDCYLKGSWATFPELTLHVSGSGCYMSKLASSKLYMVPLVLQTQSMWITSSVSHGPDCGILPCLAPSWLVLYLSQDLRKYEAHSVFATLGQWKILWGDPYTFALDVPGSVSGTKLCRGDLGSLPSLGLQHRNKA